MSRAVEVFGYNGSQLRFTLTNKEIVGFAKLRLEEVERENDKIVAELDKFDVSLDRLLAAARALLQTRYSVNVLPSLNVEASRAMRNALMLVRLNEQAQLWETMIGHLKRPDHERRDQALTYAEMRALMDPLDLTEDQREIENIVPSTPTAVPYSTSASLSDTLNILAPKS